jgi:hypothetical protein
MEYGFDVKMRTYNAFRPRLSLNQTSRDHSTHHHPYLNYEGIWSVPPTNRRGTRGQCYGRIYHTGMARVTNKSTRVSLLL